jgi:D-alanyl-lipoteichoic acid acyltransferase DltB (MBOAT superfamily)
LSKSVSEFWRRWHISLSSWFQDYVFVPLYLKVSRIKKLANMDQRKKHTVAFIISILIGETLLGIWHGANWTFVAFGLYYGIMISLYYLCRSYWDKMNSYAQIILTFIFINIGWIFFRANSIGDAFYILTHILSNLSFNFHRANIGIDWTELMIALSSIIVLVFSDIFREYIEIKKKEFKFSKAMEMAIYMALIIAILLFGVFKEVQFIYTQF